MTDAQLIELLEQKPPSELTESEIAELRLRVPHSVPLQQAVAAAIELDQSLAELLGELRISMDSILNRASAARSRPRWVWLIGGGTLALIGLVLLLVWQNWRPMVASSRTRIGSKIVTNLYPYWMTIWYGRRPSIGFLFWSPWGSLVRLSIDWMRCLLTHK